MGTGNYRLPPVAPLSFPDSVGALDDSVDWDGQNNVLRRDDDPQVAANRLRLTWSQHKCHEEAAGGDALPSRGDLIREFGRRTKFDVSLLRIGQPRFGFQGHD